MVFFSCSGAAGALTAMVVKRLGFADKYWSLLFTINGGLTGMVRKTDLDYIRSVLHVEVFCPTPD